MKDLFERLSELACFVFVHRYLHLLKRFYHIYAARQNGVDILFQINVQRSARIVDNSGSRRFRTKLKSFKYCAVVLRVVRTRVCLLGISALGKLGFVLAKRIFQIVVQRFNGIMLRGTCLLFHRLEADVDLVALFKRRQKLVLSLTVVKTQKAFLQYYRSLNGKLFVAADVDNYLCLLRKAILRAENRHKPPEYRLIHRKFVFCQSAFFRDFVCRRYGGVALDL